MKYYIKQKVFSFGDKFYIYDESGNEIFYVQGEVFSFGKKLHLYDNEGTEHAFISQKLFSFLPKYYISKSGSVAAEVVKHFTFFKQEFSVIGPEWSVTGDFFEHEYFIYAADHTVASISKEWFTWGDAYVIDVAAGEDDITAISVALVIDAIQDQQNDN
ncbi:MAG: hypothetical protein E7634_00965 [Ruminococcaceae bacterium]|nr:hypothetical protein [Oscillospiraceae bacterium]